MHFGGKDVDRGSRVRAIIKLKGRIRADLNVIQCDITGMDDSHWR